MKTWPEEGELCAVQDESGKWGFINTSGEYVIEPKFSDVSSWFEDHELWAAQDENGKWGFIDRSGEYVIEPRFVGVRGFSEGLAPAWIRKDGETAVGFIDKRGEFVIAPEYAYTEGFRDDGLALVALPGPIAGLPRVGMINRDGDIVVPIEFDGIDPVRGLYGLSKGEAFGWVNCRGEYVWGLRE